MGDRCLNNFLGAIIFLVWSATLASLLERVNGEIFTFRRDFEFGGVQK